MLNNVGVVFLVLGLAWVGQLGLTLLQMRRFYRDSARMREGSYASGTGLAGSTWKRKVYGVIVVDEHLNIMRAGKLSGFTVFAGMQPVPSIVGLPLSRIEEETPVNGVSRKLWTAFQNAAGYIRSHEEKKAGAQDSTPVKDEAGDVVGAGKEDVRGGRQD